MKKIKGGNTLIRKDMELAELTPEELAKIQETEDFLNNKPQTQEKIILLACKETNKQNLVDVT
ncbi:MAG: hypothetical protein ACOX4L_06250 [Bacillota bacterium]|jgi:hypothetical protein